jgi:membrane fusion protein (multidrug efflux system)
MNKLFRLFIALTSSSILLISCSDNKTTKQETIKIPVIKAIKQDIPIYNEYVGNMYGKKDIPIRARVEGFLESMHFKEGSKVKKGQLLYTIDPRSLESAVNAQRSKVAEAKTYLAKAKADLNRIKPLAESNAVSKSELDAAQANYEAAIASLEAAKANLNSSNIDLSYTKIKSPISGVIGKTNAQVGEFVGKNPNPVILNTVSETDTVKVKFFVPESQYIKLAKQLIQDKNDSVKINTTKETVELELADGEIYKHRGKIDFIDRNINESTGSIMVQASFPNPDGLLRSGLYSKVKVKTGVVRNAIVIPQRCIMEMQGRLSVYIVNDSNKIVNKSVSVAYKTGDIAAVSKGLQEGDLVVIDALQKVKNGMPAEPVDTVFQSKVFSEIKFSK